MRIALIAPYFPPNIGGIETYIYELAKALSKENEVYVFTCGRGITETYDGVKVFRLRAIDIKDMPVPLKIPYPIPASLLFKLARARIDLIHAHGHAFITSLQAALAARLTHKPFILTVHDVGISYRDYLIMRGVRPLADLTFISYIFKQADAVITLNNVTYKYALRFNPRKVVVIPQGINFDMFKPNDGEGEYVTFIAARLVPQKGGEVFIRTIPIVLKEESEARFLVIGDGFQRPYLERLTRELGVKDRVEFIGGIQHREVPKYLSMSKIVVFPSEIPTGLALLEAAAMRRPIITTDNEWARDTLGDTPVFIPMRSPEGTAKAIIHLLKAPDERMKVARLVNERISSERSWDAVASKHVEVYKSVLKTGKR